ncbi:MAG: ABC transporter permease [Chloroflexi bacterium]|nr:ABC transporter permease [Chloroflexota bacterium]
MSTIIRIIAAVVLFFHGLIHLMGTVVYMKLGTLEQFAYKTTILNGRVDLGESGIYIFGVLWALAAIGFVVTAAGLIAKWKWNPSLLVGVSIFSLLLTALDYKIAFTGVLVNIVILAIVLVKPRVVGLTTPQTAKG